MSKKYLITGGAGFIGSNYVHRLLKRGEKVTIYDNFARAGAPRNLDWLKQEFGGNAFNVIVGDVRDADRIAESAKGVDVNLGKEYLIKSRKLKRCKNDLR